MEISEIVLKILARVFAGLQKEVTQLMKEEGLISESDSQPGEKPADIEQFLISLERDLEGDE